MRPFGPWAHIHFIKESFILFRLPPNLDLLLSDIIQAFVEKVGSELAFEEKLSFVYAKRNESSFVLRRTGGTVLVHGVIGRQ